MSTSLISQLKASNNTVYDIAARKFKKYDTSTTCTGTAAVTTSGSYNHAKWNVIDANITAYEPGQILVIKVPVAGNGTYGTGLRINSLDYKPVVCQVTTMISTRYAVGAYIMLMYAPDISANIYISNTNTSVKGCWVVLNDYDSGNDYGCIRTTGTFKVDTYVAKNSLVALTDTGYRSLFGTGFSDSTTATKVMNTAVNFKYSDNLEILFYAGNETTATGASATSTALYSAYANADMRKMGNANTTNVIKYENSTATTGDAFPATYQGMPIYLEITIDNSYKYWHPTTRGFAVSTFTAGKFYVELGMSASTRYCINFSPVHPVFYCPTANVLVPAKLGAPNVYSYNGTTKRTDSDGTGVVLL